MNLGDHLYGEFRRHFNRRHIMVKIKILDLPDQTPWVIGGRPKERKQRTIRAPFKLLFWSN